MMRFAMSLAVAAMMAACATGPAAGDGGGAEGGVSPAAYADGRLLLRPTMAMTQLGRSVSLTDGFFLELRGDSVVSRLPYFGRAYTPTLGTGSVLDFEARATGLSKGRTADGALSIEFSARTTEDSFRFRVRVYDGDRATVDVRPQRRDQISFDCDVDGSR